MDQKDDLSSSKIDDRFRKISSDISFIPSDNLVRLADLLLQKGEEKKAHKYIKDAIVNGYDDESSTLLNHQNVKIGDMIIEHDSKINKEYKSKIDSMIYFDQCARLNTCDYSILKVDSLNMELMLKLIAQYGFPSEDKVGSTSMQNAITMILHFDRDKTNEIWKPILTEAFGKGYVSPKYYAWITDRRLAWGQEIEQYYHFIPTPDYRHFSKEKLELIQRRRDSIGLRVKHIW